MRNIVLFGFLVAGFAMVYGCQNAARSNTEDFELKNFSFSSSACNGTCPDIRMNLTGEREIQLIRTIYTGKGERDTVRSGGFKGVLSEADHNKIVDLLRKINWDTIQFPDIQCCDLPVVSIDISYGTRNRTLKSMKPPKETRELISYLRIFLANVSLPRYDKPMDFEIALPPPVNQ